MRVAPVALAIFGTILGSSEAVAATYSSSPFSRIIATATLPYRDDPEVYFSRANIKHRLKDDKGASLDYSMAIRLKPDFGDAYNNRGNVKLLLKDTTGAMNDYNEAIRLEPDSLTDRMNRPWPKPLAEVATIS